jgi:hypothetical protein
MILAPGTLPFFLGYGVANPRDCVSERFTSLVNSSEQVNTSGSLGEQDINHDCN